jgi:hypothetical protein
MGLGHRYIQIIGGHRPDINFHPKPGVDGDRGQAQEEPRRHGTFEEANQACQESREQGHKRKQQIRRDVAQISCPACRRWPVCEQTCENSVGIGTQGHTDGTGPSL